MFDGRAELACLLFDVVPSFSEGLFRARAWDVVGWVHLRLVVLLHDLSPVHLALLLGAIDAVMACCQPRVAQTLVLVVDESLCPVALPLLLCSIVRGED